MKYAKLVYNPVSGEGNFAANLDKVIKIFQQNQWQVVPVRTFAGVPATAYFQPNDGQHFDAVLAAGGDGTLHQTANALLEQGIDLPLGIFPVGTVNDIARFLRLPDSIEDCCRVILKGNTLNMDAGRANNDYFLNVASGGLLTDVPHTTPVRLKNILGRMAYYAKGFESLPRFRPLQLTVEADGQRWQEQFLLFLVLNSTAAGGFRHLAPKASVHDGLLDVVLVRDRPLAELLPLLIRLLRGQHLDDPGVEFFQTSKVTINSIQQVSTDLDGEQGPELPLQVEVVPGALKIFVP